jgi:hypothetical protein
MDPDDADDYIPAPRRPRWRRWVVLALAVAILATICAKALIVFRAVVAPDPPAG